VHLVLGEECEQALGVGLDRYSRVAQLSRVMTEESAAT